MEQDREPASIGQGLDPERRRALGGRIHRRSLLEAALGLAGGAALARTASASGAAASATAGTLAAHAAQGSEFTPAPAERQVLTVPSDPATSTVLDFFENVYARPSYAADLFSDPLVRVDKDFKIIPAAATAWNGSDDGKTWTFTLDPGLVWSDGNPVTADDWVATFRYGADPAHAWDFTWFFQGVIANWNGAIAGTVPPEEIGVVAADDHTLVVTTEVPAPYLPAMLLYSLPLSAAALSTHGPLYNTAPETAVSSGPFILSEWLPNERIVYSRNESYAGSLDVAIQKVVVKLAALQTHFTLFETNEVDLMEGLSPAELVFAQDAFPEQIYSSVGDFRTFYLFFDVTKAPFDDIKVRQAFSHVIDRDAIQASILGPIGSPAYSWLAPGFPASNRDGLKEIQKFDPELGKQLLAEAGFEGGKGFPKQELQLRAETALNQNVANAAAAMIAETLGIEIEVSNRDQQEFMASLTAKPTEIPFGYVSYGMDYLDPSNMLGVWVSGGRHSWVNEAFDTAVAGAAAFTGAPEERIQQFMDAERILVEDVPGVFIYHETPAQLVKPWVRGAALDPDASGNVSVHWPRYTTMSTVPGELAMSDEIPDDRAGT